MPQQDDDQRQDYNDRFGTPTPEQTPAQRPFVKPGVRTGVYIALVLLGTFWLIRSSGGRVRVEVQRTNSANSLKQIGYAFHNYQDTYGEFPNNTYDLDGKPLLSWRVQLLPFIEQENLYNQFRLDEPWDGPNNRPLLNQMPKIFAHPRDRGPGRGSLTYYRGFSNRGAVFEPRVTDYRPRLPFWTDDPFGVSAVKDGLSDTILVVEAGEPVEWTKPDDLDASPGKPFPKLGGMQWRKGDFQAVMADVSVRSIPVDVNEDILRALISHSGAEVLPPGWDQ